MRTSDQLLIDRIDRSSKHLPAIKALWRSHANTLGFFPDGAFEEYAAKKLILVATETSGNLLGYLLFRITPSRNDASIVHLCIDETIRNKGVATLLVKELVRSTTHLRGIGLKCRRDFNASKLWPKLGFIAVSEKAGRSASGSTLTHWWYDHNHPNLFTLAQKSELDQKLKVVIDANIFFDLKKKNNEESMALMADWLDDSIAICISDELLNEINRASNHHEREECRAFATKFPTLLCDSLEFANIYSSIKKYLPENPSEQDRSDFTHLAKAITTGADFFVTRDDAILERSNDLYVEFGISILRPADLIIELDALYREREYQPARLAGTLYEINRVQSKSENLLVNKFQNQLAGEKQTNLKEQLRRLLSSPHDTECYVAWDQKNDPIGLITYTKKEGVLQIDLLRVFRKHSLSTTIVRFLVGQLIKKSFSENCHVIQVCDKFLDTETVEALIEDHFISTNDGWLKLSLPLYASSSELIGKLDELSQHHSDLKEYCLTIQSSLVDSKASNDIVSLWEIEVALSPALITDSDIPCFIVPIKPQWAKQLFDEHLASQDLFGAKVDLALNREGVYYRSIRNSFGLAAPARIIWYVSQNNRFPGSGSLRAYSRLDEVVVGYPKPLFRQFRRLGIYEWEDVLNTANGDNKQLMALRFSNTAMLEKPLPWDKAINSLSSVGIRTQLQSPCPIPESLFFSLISQS